jgi:hypothetical protein
MLKDTMKQIVETTRSLLKNPGSLAIFAGLYALLLATLYGFIATREAKVWQVLLTLLFVASAPAIFFLMQAAIINQARQGKIEWYLALRASCKLALLTLPLIFVGVGIVYLLNRWQAHFPAPHLAPLPLVSAAAPGKPVATPPTHWPTVWFATARALIFVIALPLAMIQLWVDLGRQNLLTFIRSGARAVLKSLGQTLSRAFAPASVLIYSLGLIVFALTPYVLLFVRVPLGGTWRELGVFSARLALVFVFTLFGWVLTLSTFAKANDGPVLPSPILAAGEPNPRTSITTDDGEGWDAA